MIPDQFDLETWRTTTALSFEGIKCWSGSTTFPAGIVATEEVRRIAAGFGDMGRSVPCDVFLLAKGEPDDHSRTKIGGLPYRPANHPWPRTEENTPYFFVCQFRLRDSRDILPPVPNDVLLVFSRESTPYTGDPPCLHFEWWPLGLTDLVAPDDVPPPPRPFLVGYGVRHRTVDFIDSQKCNPLVAQAIQGELEKTEDEFRRTLIVETHCRLSGVKVGGAAPWLDRSRFVVPDDEQFLCSLCDVVPPSDVPYPWLNQPTPVSIQELLSTRADWLLWYDGFILNMFLTPTNEISWYLDLG